MPKESPPPPSLALQKLRELQAILIKQRRYCRSGDFSTAEGCFGVMENCIQAISKLSFNPSEDHIWKQLRMECQYINAEIKSHLENKKKLLAKEYLRNNVGKELLRLNF